MRPQPCEVSAVEEEVRTSEKGRQSVTGVKGKAGRDHQAVPVTYKEGDRPAPLNPASRELWGSQSLSCSQGTRASLGCQIS